MTATVPERRVVGFMGDRMTDARTTHQAKATGSET